MKIVVGYESYHGNTRTMAYALERGAREAGAETVIRNIRQIKPFDIKNADVVVVATPTYHQKPPSNVRYFMKNYDNFDFSGKTAFVLGSCEELGDAIDQTIDFFRSKGATVLTPPIKVKGKPTKADLESCQQKGSELATTQRF
ncbi:MAG: flavodoxin domain-containing protein [Halobacteriota archaeon]|jgi:flavorubredoxin